MNEIVQKLSKLEELVLDLLQGMFSIARPCMMIRKQGRAGYDFGDNCVKWTQLTLRETYARQILNAN